MNLHFLPPRSDNAGRNSLNRIPNLPMPPRVYHPTIAAGALGLFLLSTLGLLPEAGRERINLTTPRLSFFCTLAHFRWAVVFLPCDFSIPFHFPFFFGLVSYHLTIYASSFLIRRSNLHRRGVSCVRASSLSKKYMFILFSLAPCLCKFRSLCTMLYATCLPPHPM